MAGTFGQGWTFSEVPAGAPLVNLADMPFLNVRSFGAIGDGTSRPLNTRFSTLADAQAMYPSAAALTDELDGVAIQKSINYLRDNGGGTVFLPRGKYTVNTSLLLPESGKSLAPGYIPGVSIKGEGPTASIIYCNIDLGSGNAVITCASRSTSGLGSSGVIEDIGIIGIDTNTAMGTASCQMRAINHATGRNINRVHIQGFYAGVAVCGGQTEFRSIYTNNCYYGLYWDVPNNIAFGDHLFERCVFDSCKKAGIAAGANVNIANTTFISCIVGGSPYGCFKETGGSTNNLLYGCKLYMCQFENIGNGMVSDDKADDTTRVVELFGVEFDKVQFLWSSSTFKIGALPATAIISANIIDRCKILSMREPQAWTPGSAYWIFYRNYMNETRIEGDVKAILDAVTAAGVALFNKGPSISCKLYQDGSRWAGYWAFTTGTITVGDVVTGTGGGVQRATGAQNENIAGVVVWVQPTSNRAVVATEGYMTVNTNGAVATDYTQLQAGAAGVAIPVVAGSTATASILGTVNDHNNGSSTATVNIKTVNTQTMRAPVTLTGGLISIDMSLATTFIINATSDVTMNNPTNPFVGQVYTFIVKQDATGGRTITWNSRFKFSTAWSDAGNTAGLRSIISFVCETSAVFRQISPQQPYIA